MTTTRLLSAQSARTLAARFLHGRTSGRGWSTVADRDLARESQELMVLSQGSHDRTH
ncbi:MAG TPA: hypothetical protein VES95_12850 [Dermatophilaceae bacterium]|nr:hypothetical protein [Dermatophilaceae bacterium]